MTAPADKKQRNIALLGGAAAAKTDVFHRITYTAAEQTVYTPKSGAAFDVTPFEVGNGGLVSDQLGQITWGPCEISVLMGQNGLEPQPGLDLTTSAVEGAILILDSKAELTLEDALVHRHCLHRNLPCIAFLNDADIAQKSCQDIVAQMQARFGVDVLLTQLPLVRAGRFAGVIDVIGMRVHCPKNWLSEGAGDSPPTELMADEHASAVAARRLLSSQVADLNDQTLEIFLADEDGIDETTLRGLIGRAQRERGALPVYVGSGFPGIGIEPLLDGVLDWIPPPRSVDMTLHPRQTPKYVARILGVVDILGGPVTLIRVLSGTLEPGDVAVNFNSGRLHSNLRLIQFHDDQKIELEQATPGDILALQGEFPSCPGDLLSNISEEPKWHKSDFLAPLIEVDLHPLPEDDSARLEDTFEALSHRNPSFQVFTLNGKITLRLTGEDQLSTILDTVEQSLGTRPAHDAPRPLYREMLADSAEIEEIFKRQSGLDVFARVRLCLGPKQDGSDLVFTSQAPSENISSVFVDAVQSGLSRAMQNRFRKGFPIHGLTAHLIDGVEHMVDSRPLGFEVVAQMALDTACAKVGTKLFEPIMLVDLVIPSVNHATVLQDMAERRASIIITTHDSDRMHIQASAPRASLFGYDQMLAELTDGKGEYAMQFEQYSLVPHVIADQLRQNLGRLNHA